MNHARWCVLALALAFAGLARADEPFAEGMVSLTFDDEASARQLMLAVLKAPRG